MDKASWQQAAEDPKIVFGIQAKAEGGKTVWEQMVEAAYLEGKLQELWEDYSHKLVALEQQVTFLHHDTLGMYASGDLSQRIAFLTKQIDELARLHQENAEFINSMLRIQTEAVNNSMSRVYGSSK